jgi:hypothetical protein
MSRRVAFFLSAIAFVLLVAEPRTSDANAWSLDRGQYYNSFTISVFDANSYHDQDGKRINFPGHFERRTARWTGEVGWKKRMNFLMGASAASVSQAFESPTPYGPTLFPSTTPAALNTKTAFATFDLGLRYRLSNGATASAIEARWELPGGYDRATMWAIGDGRQQLSGAFLFGTALGKKGFVDLAGGLSYRYLSLSPSDADKKDPLRTSMAQTIGSADIGWWLTHTFMLAGNYRGKMLISSNSTAQPSDPTHFYGPIPLPGDEQLDSNVHNAGAQLLYRVDERLDVIGGVISEMSGKNTFHNDRFYVALAFKQTSLGRLQGFAGGTRP